MTVTATPAPGFRPTAVTSLFRYTQDEHGPGIKCDPCGQRVATLKPGDCLMCACREAAKHHWEDCPVDFPTAERADPGLSDETMRMLAERWRITK